MDPKQFTDKALGRLIRVGKGEGAYWAFVPNPLPPEIGADWELTNILAEAKGALSELAGLGRIIPNPNLLINPFVRREAVLSSKIEGTLTQIEHLYAYEAGQLEIPGFGPSPPEPDVREVVNYVNAMKYGLNRLKDFPFVKRFVRELHEKLMEDVRGGDVSKTPGEFRRSPNWIGTPGDTPSRATYVPPPVDEMEKTLDDFERYLNLKDDRYPDLIKLSLIHYQFEAIHPFLDGNGRIGRLLITLLIVKWDLLPQPLLYLSAYFEKHREEYYRHLMCVSTHGAWREWLIFFLKGVSEQSKDAISRAKALQDLQTYWREHCRQQYQSNLILDIVDLFFLSPLWTVSEIAKYLHKTYMGIKMNIQKLIEEEFLKEITGKSYGKLFLSPKVLQIITQEFPNPLVNDPG
ncbi:Fic family protein [candidate division WOR-3 bacterium]|uniref:Fic family protein n=1 Tax=candidate division WOR-3 bacterium TaxID=2052148 RepID=A0A9D5QDA5_UNCW3|nr:Fic family protein [candidate division WOR-3 bacterium]MBD3365548.1 Fic family protein [candidate division WOR-3 bacterium]